MCLAPPILHAPLSLQELAQDVVRHPPPPQRFTNPPIPDPLDIIGQSRPVLLANGRRGAHRKRRCRVGCSTAAQSMSAV